MVDPSEILTLGGPWSWSDIASRDYARRNGLDVKVMLLVPRNRTEGIIEALTERYKSGDWSVAALVPIWNTNEGRVKDTIRPYGGLLKHPGIKIAGEYVQDIEQSAAGYGTRKDIRKIVSHPQGIAQCSAWLDKLKSEQNVEITPVESTSVAADIARQDTSGRTAAICSPQAAEAYDLPLIERGIDQNGNGINKTRFVLLSYKDAEPSEQDKTTLTMELYGEGKAGTLYRTLGVLAGSGINVSYIESMPKGSLTEYVFWLDVDEHRKRIEKELERMNGMARWLQIHGSYPRAYP